VIGRGDRRGTPADLLVIGLGNPGKDYVRTRHNVGVEVLDLLCARYSGKLAPSKLKALTCELRVEGKLIAVAFPTTFMNESGQSGALLVKRYGIDDPEQLVIVHDELDLAPGVVKVKRGGGLAGHNGLRSLKAHLQTDEFVRIRLGVGKPPNKDQGANFVLGRFPKAEREIVDVAVERAADAVIQILTAGVDATMTSVNALG
jgi:peptidyl-tRNA hydrolase, PTH1 family